MSAASDTAIASTAAALASLYWDLAEELRSASIALATVTEAGGTLPIVGTARLARAIEGGMILGHLAGRGQQ